MASQPQVTVFPPAQQDVHFDQSSFSKRTLAVKKLTGRPSTDSTLSFEDYGRMHLVGPIQNSKHRYRRMPIPEWALNDELLREVITRYLEYRNYLPTGTGKSYEERLAAVEAETKRRTPRYMELLTKRLEKNTSDIEIQNMDSRIVLEKKGFPALVASVVYLSYRLNYNSVEVAQATGVKPYHVRVLLWRLRKTAREIEDGKVRQPKRIRTGRNKRRYSPEMLEILWNARFRSGAKWSDCAVALGLKCNQGCRAQWVFKTYFDGPSAHLYPGRKERKLRPIKPPGPPRRRLDREMILKLYRKLTVGAIARKLDASYMGVRRLLLREGRLRKPTARHTSKAGHRSRRQ